MTKSVGFHESYIPEPNSGCWLWIRGTNGAGYGRIYKPVKMAAHRYAWQLYKGEIQQGEQVLHRCDTPLCVNPEHLFIGTNDDNMRDKNRKRRGTVKLTEQQVATIKLSSQTNTSLAKQYGVCDSTISDIRTKTTWKHV